MHLLTIGTTTYNMDLFAYAVDTTDNYREGAPMLIVYMAGLPHSDQPLYLLGDDREAMRAALDMAQHVCEDCQDRQEDDQHKAEQN